MSTERPNGHNARVKGPYLVFALEMGKGGEDRSHGGMEVFWSRRAHDFDEDAEDLQQGVFRGG